MGSDSECELLSVFNRLSLATNEVNSSDMDQQQLQALVQSAVTGALQAQAALFENQFKELRGCLDNLKTTATPHVESYERATIDRTVKCDDGLDVVKGIAEFSGDMDRYSSWRRAASDAYEQFSVFAGSVKHYQAVNIIRNKVVGAADGILTSFNTPLNFKAIIARLDFSYGDRTPLHVLEQQMSLLRQGDLSVRAYYEVVEKKLAKITNKAVMSFDPTVAVTINDKYRQDALRVFISGLKKSMSETLFSCRVTDLPSALALAEEIGANRDRYNFATNFAKLGEVREEDQRKFIPKIKPQLPSPKSRDPEPMDIDPSMSRVKISNNLPTRTGSNFDRNLGRTRQRGQGINSLQVDPEYQAYQMAALEALDDVVSDSEPESDEVNFLGETPCYLTLKGQSQGEK